MASPAPAKSQPLHNFSLPHHLTWKKNHTTTTTTTAATSSVDHHHHHHHHRSRTRLSTPPPPPPPPPPPRRQSPLLSESESGFRRKRSPASSSRRQSSPSYSSSCRTQSPLLDSTISEKDQRSKISIRFGKNKLDEEKPTTDVVVAAAEEEELVPKTWNLRPRRPINKQSDVNVNMGVHKYGGSLLKETRSVICNEVVHINPVVVEKKEKKVEYSISLTLSRSEIEEDLYALTGSKPSRRPKKRSKIVQRQIETLLPGFWLGTINADSYKVPEAPSKV